MFRSFNPNQTIIFHYQAVHTRTRPTAKLPTTTTATHCWFGTHFRIDNTWIGWICHPRHQQQSPWKVQCSQALRTNKSTHKKVDKVRVFVCWWICFVFLVSLSLVLSLMLFHLHYSRLVCYSDSQTAPLPNALKGEQPDTQKAQTKAGRRDAQKAQYKVRHWVYSCCLFVFVCIDFAFCAFSDAVSFTLFGFADGSSSGCTQGWTAGHTEGATTGASQGTLNAGWWTCWRCVRLTFGFPQVCFALFDFLCVLYIDGW